MAACRPAAACTCCCTSGTAKELTSDTAIEAQPMSSTSEARQSNLSRGREQNKLKHAPWCPCPPPGTSPSGSGPGRGPGCPSQSRQPGSGRAGGSAHVGCWKAQRNTIPTSLPRWLASAHRGPPRNRDPAAGHQPTLRCWHSTAACRGCSPAGLLKSVMPQMQLQLAATTAARCRAIHCATRLPALPLCRHPGQQAAGRLGPHQTATGCDPACCAVLPPPWHAAPLAGSVCCSAAPLTGSVSCSAAPLAASVWTKGGSHLLDALEGLRQLGELVAAAAAAHQWGSHARQGSTSARLQVTACL